MALYSSLDSFCVGSPLVASWQGLTALHWTLSCTTATAPEIIHALIEAGADTTARDRDGLTPEDLAMEQKAPPATLAALRGEPFEHLPKTVGGTLDGAPPSMGPHSRRGPTLDKTPPSRQLADGLSPMTALLLLQVIGGA